MHAHLLGNTISIFTKNTYLKTVKDLLSRIPTCDAEAVTKVTARKVLYLAPNTKKCYWKAAWTVIYIQSPSVSYSWNKWIRNPAPFECLDRVFGKKKLGTVYKDYNRDFSLLETDTLHVVASFVTFSSSPKSFFMA